MSSTSSGDGDLSSPSAFNRAASAAGSWVEAIDTT